MRGLKQLFPLLSLLPLLLPVVSCGSQHDADEKYFLVTDNLQVQYWQTAKAGFLHEAARMKVLAENVGPDTFDPQGQLQEFRKAVQHKPAGILISVADPTVMSDDINKAIAAGIPVITMDSDAPASKRLFFIGTNNYHAGVIGGGRLADALHGKGNVVVFTMPAQANVNERLRGYRDALAPYPQIKFTQIVDIRGDPRVAFDTTGQILGKEKDKVDAFLCLEAQAGKEVATVLSNNKITGKVVIAMDTDPETLNWIQKGVIAATISQKPYTMASFGLRMLDNLHHNKLDSLDQDWSKDSFAPIPSFVDTGSSLIDKNNVAAFMNTNQSITSAPK
jgi:ribose transport system substrate-binding protein